MSAPRPVPSRIIARFAMAAVLIAVLGLFVPFFSVLHIPFNVWKIHLSCSLAAYARAHATTAIIIIPPMGGSVERTCSAVSVAWPALVGLGLLGLMTGTAAFVWRYARTQSS